MKIKREIHKLTDKDLLQMYLNRKLSLEDLRLSGDLDERRYKTIMILHLKQLLRSGALNREDIVERGRVLGLDESDLRSGGLMGTENRKDSSPVEPIDIPWVGEGEYPKVKPGPYDVFIFGMASSGKSCFLGGLLQFGHLNGRIDPDNENSKGYAYGHALIKAVYNGLPLPATPATDIQYISVDFEDINGHKHPFNLLEMAGEAFEDIWGKSKKELESPEPGKLFQVRKRMGEYLFNPNMKIVFLVTDCSIPELEIRGGQNVSQYAHLENMVKNLNRWGVLRRVKALSLLITKWDLHWDQSPDAEEKFLQEHYQNVIKHCVEAQKQYGFHFELNFFSLGEFDQARNSYQYDPTSSEKIFDWMCEVTGKKKLRKRSWWQRILNR